MMASVRIQIDSFEDRNGLFAILANNGYKTWVEVEKAKSYIIGNKYFVCFEFDEKEVE